jgi:hypothetical protein
MNHSGILRKKMAERPEPEFDYSLWTAGTNVTLCNVPWSSDYRDIYYPSSRAVLDSYLALNSGPVVKIRDMTYARFGAPVKVDVPFTVAQNYNYLRVFNPAQPIAGDVDRAYYYFIIDVVHVNPNTTSLFLQLDAWATFGFEFEFGNSYLEQGHMGIANEDQFTHYGRDYLTVPEGLDVGGEYVISDIYSHSVGSARDDNLQTYRILVTSIIDLTADNGTVEDPKLKMASGNLSENLPNAADVYDVGQMDNFKAMLTALKDQPHVLQGIQSIVAIPFVYEIPGAAVLVGGVGVTRLTSGGLHNEQTEMAPNWRDDVFIPTRYRHLKKFLTYPYMILELTANTGTPIMLKPESWQNKNATVNEIPHFASASARVMFTPHNYNAVSDTILGRSDGKGLIRDGGEFLDMATGIFNFPTFSVLNDGYQLYLANNRNGLAYQYSSADWSQQRATMGMNTSYDQASAGIGAANESNRIGVNAAIQSTGISNETAAMSMGVNAINSIGRGAAGGLTGLAGGLAGAATGGLQTAIGINSANRQLGVSTGASNAQTANSTGLSSYVRDSNLGLAQAANHGDYQNQIAGIQAKVQDAKMIQPTTAGQVGGDAFLLARYQIGYDLRVKTMSPDAMAQVGDYWLRYGYRVNRFTKIPKSLKVMTRFTYWKLKESYVISSQCPEMYKQVIRGIFEKGVTVWSIPTDIGNVDLADNDPLPGVTL